MGWDFMRKPANVKQYLATEEFSGKLANGGYAECLDVKIVNLRTAYAAVKYTYPDGSSKVSAVVALLSYTKGYYNFGVKVMDESVLPYSFECPESILNMLTPTDNIRALEWRHACRQLIQAKKLLRLSRRIK